MASFYSTDCPVGGAKRPVYLFGGFFGANMGYPITGHCHPSSGSDSLRSRQYSIPAKKASFQHVHPLPHRIFYRDQGSPSSKTLKSSLCKNTCGAFDSPDSAHHRSSRAHVLRYSDQERRTRRRPKATRPYILKTLDAHNSIRPAVFLEQESEKKPEPIACK